MRASSAACQTVLTTYYKASICLHLKTDCKGYFWAEHFCKEVIRKHAFSAQSAYFWFSPMTDLQKWKTNIVFFIKCVFPLLYTLIRAHLVWETEPAHTNPNEFRTTVRSQTEKKLWNLVSAVHQGFCHYYLCLFQTNSKWNSVLSRKPLTFLCFTNRMTYWIASCPCNLLRNKHELL